MKKLLIANRGEIAVRIAHTCADSGIGSVAIYADPDADALHVRVADEAYSLEGVSVPDTYINIDKILAIAERSGADAVHPGYGFLAERADFAQAVIDAGLIWVGPSPETITLLGDKVAARKIAESVGAPLVRGSDGVVPDAKAAVAAAKELGLPIAIKAAFGGGGRGMRRVDDREQLRGALEWFDIDFGDIDGLFTDLVLTVEHDTFENFGFGFGLNNNSLDIESGDDSFRGIIDLSFRSVIVYFKGSLGKGRRPRG